MNGRQNRVDDEDLVVRTYRHTDPTTAIDRRRIREARMEVRARLRDVRRDDAGSRRDIFRREIGTNVRSVSPFLLSLVESQGESLAALLDRIEPAPRWPRAPALSARPHIQFRRAREPYRRFTISTSTGDREVIRLRGFGPGLLFMWSRDDWACLDVVDHSLEVEARIGPVKFDTLFGVLRIELDHRIPDSLAAACVGRSICEVVDHPALRGRHWMIGAVEEAPSPSLGQTLVVEAGSLAFRLPWVR